MTRRYNLSHAAGQPMPEDWIHLPDSVVAAADYDALRAERDEIARRADLDVIERNRIIAEKSAEVEALRKRLALARHHLDAGSYSTARYLIDAALEGKK